MAIHFTASVSGTQIGEELGRDPEELAEALLALSVEDAAELGQLVAGYLSADYAREVAGHLRRFAGAMEGAV